MRVLLLLLCVAAAGCAFYQAPPRETPAVPVFDDVTAAREGQVARAAPDVPRRVGARFEAYGLQPLTRADRRHGLGRDTIAAAFIPGRDPLRSGRLIVVGVSQTAAPAALGGFLELSRGMVRLARHYLIPEPTLLFITLPSGRESQVLTAMTHPPIWPSDSVQAVVLIGGSAPAGTVQVVPAEPTAGATARMGYALLKRIAYNHRANDARGAAATGF